MKTILFLLFSPILLFPPPMYITKDITRMSSALNATNLSGNGYCEIIKELYLQSEWYLKFMSQIDADSHVWIKKFFVQVIKVFYDYTADDLRNMHSEYEKLVQKAMILIERSLGVMNPLNLRQWRKIMIILLAQVSKRQDAKGSVCLRPSQAGIVLYSVLQLKKVGDEEKEELVRIFVNNLKDGHNYEPDVIGAVEGLFAEQERYYKFKDFYERFMKEDLKKLKNNIEEQLF